MSVHIIRRGEAIAEITLMPPESIDIVLTDPPYFMPALHYMTEAKENGRTFADMGIFEYYFSDYFAQVKRVLKPKGVVYMFCNSESYPIFYYHAFKNFGRARVLVWDKMGIGPGSVWRHVHELILFSCKGSLQIGGGDSDIIRCKRVKYNDKVHPAQKPTDLLEKLIKKHTDANLLRMPAEYTVLDTFAGSGSTIEACRRVGCKGIAIESDRSYFDKMVQRYNTDAVQKRFSSF